MLWNQGMSFQSRPGSMNDCVRSEAGEPPGAFWRAERRPALTLIARAAPWDRSTFAPCLFSVTSAGSSASNFMRMSYDDQDKKSVNTM